MGQINSVGLAAVQYTGSLLDMSCKAKVCGSPIRASLALCPGSSFNVTAVCRAPLVKATEPALRAQIRLSGAKILDLFRKDYFGLLRNVRTDLSTLLKILEELIQISSMRPGSLIVDFQVYAAAGQTLDVAALEAAVKAIKPADLSSTSAFYSANTVGGGSLGVEVGFVSAGPSVFVYECKGGCIAGIVIGSFVFVVLLVVIGVVMNKKFGTTGVKSEPATENTNTV